MKSRDWLITKGLTKPGSRGRLSRAAHAALQQAIAEGMQFDDYKSPTIAGKPIVARSKPLAEELTKAEPRREETKFWVIDRGVGQMQLDIVIGFSSCAACGKSVRYCTHDEPRPPKFVNADKIYFKRPVV